MGADDVLVASALAVLLGIAVWTDLRTRTIDNRLTAAVALLAPLSWWATSTPLWPAAAVQVGVALFVFALFAVAFAFGLMGGGDVKLIGALALWRVPTISEPAFAALIELLTTMAIAGGVLTVAMLIAHRLRKAAGRPEIPYGVAIAVGAFCAYGERYLNQFG